MQRNVLHHVMKVCWDNLVGGPSFQDHSWLIRFQIVLCILALIFIITVAPVRKQISSAAVNDRMSSNRRVKNEVNSEDSDDSVQVSTRYEMKKNFLSGRGIFFSIIRREKIPPESLQHF